MSFRQVTAVAFFAATFFIAFTSTGQNSMGVGTTTPNPNSVLELVSPTGNQGFLVPRYTTAERTASTFTNNLAVEDNGLLVFDTDEGKFYCWFSNAWQEISNSSVSVSAGAGIGIDGAGVISNTGDLDVTNEIQDLDLTGDILSITNNGAATQVDLAPYKDNTDSQTATEVPFTPAGSLTSTDVQSALTELDANDLPQDLALASDILTITDNGSATPIDLSIYMDNTDDQTAAEVAFTSSGALTSTDVQSALDELDANMGALGSGDMMAAAYDVNLDNRIDLAESSDSLSVNFIDGITMGYNPASKWIEVLDNGVTEAKIADGAVSSAKIGILASEGDAMIYSAGTWQAGALPTSPWLNFGGGISYTGGNVALDNADALSTLQIFDDFHFYHFDNGAGAEGEIISENMYGDGAAIRMAKDGPGAMMLMTQGSIEFYHSATQTVGTDVLTAGSLQSSLTLSPFGDAEFSGAVKVGLAQDGAQSGMIQYDGEFQGFDGAEWKPLGGLTFPASYLISDTGYSPFYIENDNGGGVAGFHVNNTAAFAPALSVSTNAQNASVPAMELLQDGYGNGLEVTVSDNSNGENGIIVNNFGLGTAGYFENDNGSNTSNALEARITNGGGRAIQAVMDGEGQIASFSSTSATNGSVAFSVSSQGTNSTALFQNSSNATITPAVEIVNNGGGAGLTIQNPGGTTSFGDVSFINGDLGIGQFTPSAKLDVVGDTELNGNATISGNLNTSGSVAYSANKIISNQNYVLHPEDYAITMTGSGFQNFTLLLPDASENLGRELVLVVTGTEVQYNVQLAGGNFFGLNNGGGNSTADVIMSLYAFPDWYFVKLKAVGNVWYVVSHLQNSAA